MTIQVASTSTNRQWVLAGRPVDRAVRDSDFRLAEAPVPMPRALMRLYSGQNTGKQLVRVDPTAR